MAVVDLRPGQEKVVDIWPLGLKDWNRFPADLSDRNGVLLRTWPNAYAWYQPDTIRYAKINDKAYLVRSSRTAALPPLRSREGGREGTLTTAPSPEPEP